MWFLFFFIVRKLIFVKTIWRGTDTAGSGRVPAAFNNVIGLKPSIGVISTEGVIPACKTLDCVSIFGLTVPDTILVLQCAKGNKNDQKLTKIKNRSEILSDSLGKELSISTFHFGFPNKKFLKFFGNEEAEKLYYKSIENFQKIGGIPIEIEFDSFVKVADLLYSGPWVSERTLVFEDFLKDKSDYLHPITKKILETGFKFSSLDVYKSIYELNELKEKIQLIMDKIDIILLPTTGTIYKVTVFFFSFDF